MLITLAVLVVLLWSVTSGTGFWRWMATRNGKQLFLLIVVITLIVWAAAQIAGFGPK